MAPPSTLWLYPMRREDLARTTAAATYVLRVTVDATTEDLTTASLTADRNYWFAGDAQADADGSVGGVGDLIAILQALLDTHSVIVGGEVVEVTLSAANVITVSCSQDITLLWAHANTTLNALPFGWAQTNTSASITQMAPNQTDGCWAPGYPFREDSREQQPVTTRIARSLSGRIRTSRVSLPRKIRRVSYHLLERALILDEYATTTRSFERMQRNAISYGRQLRVYDDATSRSSSSYGLYVADQDIEDPLFQRDDQTRLRWQIPPIQLRRFSL